MRAGTKPKLWAGVAAGAERRTRTGNAAGFNRLRAYASL